MLPIMYRVKLKDEARMTRKQTSQILKKNTLERQNVFAYRKTLRINPIRGKQMRIYTWAKIGKYENLQFKAHDNIRSINLYNNATSQTYQSSK